LAEQIALLEIGNSLAHASELDDILQLVVKHASPADTPTAKATIHLIDHDSLRLLPRAVSQSSGEPAHAVGFDPNQGIAGRAVHEKRLIYVPDVNKEPDFVNTNEDFRSLIVVPLTIENVPEGTLSVTSPHVDAFDEDTIRQLTSLANQASIALRKAQITERLRKSNAELEMRSKELEASIVELKSTQRQLIQASKLASMGTLTAGIAHEINNPLAGIKLFAQNTKRAQTTGNLKPEKMIQNLEKISDLVDKAAKIIEHLRTFSRQATGHMELMRVNQAVEDSLSMLSEQLKLQNIEINLQLDENLPQVRGDTNQIEQVVLNLITNARDSLDRAEKKEIRERHPVRDHRKRLRSILHDQTRGQRDGPGLIHKSRNRGAPWRRDRSREHTRQRIHFPDQTASRGKWSGKRLMQETAHILVVDDEPSVREGLSDMLSICGHIVTCANDGQQGLELFHKALERDELPPFDILIFDIKMPNMSGLELMERVVKLDPEIPIIIITGHGDSNTATYALAGGAYDYITKPLEPDLVLDAVTRALAIGRLRRRFRKTVQNAGVIGAITSGIAKELDTPLNNITRAAEELSKQLNQIKHLTSLTLQADDLPETNIPIADIDMDPAYKQIEVITRSVLHCIRLLEALDLQPPQDH
ncbi:MAG: response regulator, partial [Anaerolineales bacterium]